MTIRKWWCCGGGNEELMLLMLLFFFLNGNGNFQRPFVCVFFCGSFGKRFRMFV